MDSMRFAVFMFPIIFTLCGLIMWIAGRPQKYKWWAGYRTPRATKNQETWVFAQKYFGKLSMLSGLTTLTFSIGVFIHAEYMQEITNWAIYSQVAAFILIFLFTEIALRNEFDENGKRRR